MKKSISSYEACNCDTNTAKMEGINGDFTRLDHHHQSSCLKSPPPSHAEQQSLLLNIIPTTNIANNDNNNNNNPTTIINDNDNPNSTDYYDYYISWMRINSRPKLWTLIVFCTLIAIFAIVLVKRYGAIFMYKEVIPFIHWLVENFSRPALAAVVFIAIALLPTVLLPTVPFKWVAGMAFGYGICFVLIVAAEAVAVSLPFVISYRYFLHRIRKFLDHHPREAAIIRLAGDGDWFHQFQAVVLIRLAPVPYVLFNYTAVATGVRYTPYLAGSLLGLVPEVFIAIYSGKLILNVADAMEDHTPFSRSQILFDGIGLLLTIIATIVIGIYSKKRLKQLQDDEEQLQQF